MTNGGYGPLHLKILEIHGADVGGPVLERLQAMMGQRRRLYTVPAPTRLECILISASQRQAGR